MKKIMLFICLIVITLSFCGCSNQELEDLKVEVQEKNMKTEMVMSSYVLSEKNIGKYNNGFVENLYNFDSQEDIDFSSISSITDNLDFSSLNFIYKARLLQYTNKYINTEREKNIEKYLFEESSDFEEITVEEVKTYMIENKEQYTFLDSETGNVTNMVFFKFPDGTVFELISEWFEGVLINIEMTKRSV